jgi:hypothetical protein
MENKEKTWTVTLEEDPETGDLLMPLPDEVLEHAGWAEGDTLLWQVEEGRIVVSKIIEE